MSLRPVAIFFAAVGTLGLGSLTAHAAAPDFERQIAPILIKNCLRCHNGSDPASELNLSEKTAAFKGGESGSAAIVAKDVDASYLMNRVRDGEMPPPGKGQPLSPEQIELLSAWISDGAAWPDGRALSLFEFTTEARAGRDWWSLQPVKPVAVPDTGGDAWVRTPIDAFILAKLKQRGLQPSAAADRVTLLRRVMFDVWGLPPSPEDVDSFVADNSPDAYERLVDRLLDSPHYGERWATHWLDVVRFAESNGYEENTARPNAWPYRDYVIDAFNRDIPYKQFIFDQLAGDQCGADAATGFLVAGSHDEVGSPNEELTRQQRHNDLDDMVSTTSQTFMAMSAGCAKCHDHKFDTIAQRDYYALQAMFSGITHGERTITRPLDDKTRAELTAMRSRLIGLQRQMGAVIARSEPLARVGFGDPAAEAVTGDARSPRSPVHAARNFERFSPVTARFVRFTVTGTSDGEVALHRRNRGFLQRRRPQRGLGLGRREGGSVQRDSQICDSPDRSHRRRPVRQRPQLDIERGRPRLDSARISGAGLDRPHRMGPRS